jgi:hypothetical protein
MKYLVIFVQFRSTCLWRKNLICLTPVKLKKKILNQNMIIHITQNLFYILLLALVKVY